MLSVLYSVQSSVKLPTPQLEHYPQGTGAKIEPAPYSPSSSKPGTTAVVMQSNTSINEVSVPPATRDGVATLASSVFTHARASAKTAPTTSALPKQRDKPE